jgi:signal transduction histidine kinase
MLELLADSAAVAAPLALTCATVAVAERRRDNRRRERLNRALHELRRPLQALVLAVRQRPRSAPAQLDLALDALETLDREVNGTAQIREMRPADARTLVEQAAERWRDEAGRRGRRIEIGWSANGSRVVCVRAQIARALDNLLSNALEHGRGPIRIAGTARDGRLRLMVADGTPPAPAAVPIPPASRLRRGSGDPRRGHGLRVVADVAAGHGGRFATCRHHGGMAAILELPLA